MENIQIQAGNTNRGLLRFRLIVMNFLQYAVWGSYLCSLGVYLNNIGMQDNIGPFYAVQGIVSLFMPTLMGIVADRWMPAQKVYGLCLLLSAAFMAGAAYMGMTFGQNVSFGQLFPLYAASVAFFMPTIALGNSVSYNALTKAGMDTIKDYPPIRVFGTVGFIAAMWIVNFSGFFASYMQMFASASWGILAGIYAFSLPDCPIDKSKKGTSLADSFGLRAFSLFKDRKMCLFFIFSFLLGMCLQVTNGFAVPYLATFNMSPELKDTFAVQNPVFLSSISQISETLCILLIPFFLKRFGIKKVMFISFMAWFLRFGLLGVGNPVGIGLVWLVCSMLVYGVAFDFFNISGSLLVDKNTDEGIRSSAQGVFMMMTNGLGATVGAFIAGKVVVHFTQPQAHLPFEPLMEGWRNSWFVFAAFALIVGILFAIFFKYKHTRE